MLGVSIFLRFLNRVLDFIGDIITTCVLWGTMLFGYVCLSLVIYAVLRRLVVPEKFHAKPVHFQYEPCLPQQAQNGLCPFPRADFVLGANRRLLVSGQPYQVEVILELPESPVNMELGVFMVNLSFYSSAGRVISSSARPVLLRYKSYIVQVASTFLYLIPLTLGLMEQKQIIPVELYESYYDSYSEPAMFASVVITSHHIQVYSAVLTIEATFSGFIYLLYQWPVTMALVTSFCICTWLIMCTVALWVRDWVGPVRRVVRRPSMQPRQVLSPRYVANVSPVQAPPPRRFSTPPPRGYVGQGGPKLVATAGGRFAVISEEDGKQMKRNLSVEDTRKLLLQHGVQPEMLPRSYSDVFPSSDSPSLLRGSPPMGETPAATNRPLSDTPSLASASSSKDEPALPRRLSSGRKVSFNISEDEDTSDDAHKRDVYRPADDQSGVPRFRKTKL